MRIAIWSTSFPPSLGGLQRFSESLAGWLATRGHMVVVLTDSAGLGDVDERLPYEVLRCGGSRDAIRAMRGADAVHVAGLSLRGMSLAWASGIRPVVTHQGPHAVCPAGLAWSDKGSCSAGPSLGPCRFCPQGGLRGRADVIGHRAGARAGARNVFVSKFLSHLLSLPGPVVYNPLPASLFDEGREGADGDVIVAAGRLVREKGFDLLVRAMKDVDARLILAGDGPVRGSLESLVEDIGVRERVTFTGRLPLEELADLYARAAIACVPTWMGEPFGYAVAEAMAIGVPVVGTPTGAIPELLAEGRGYVAPRSTPAALAATIREALADRDERVRRAVLARGFARDELHVDVIGRRYEELYAL